MLAGPKASYAALLAAMMKPAHLRNDEHRAALRGFNCSGLWRILAQRQMRSRVLVIRKIRRQDATQRSMIPDDHMVEALATNGADDGALHKDFAKDSVALITSSMPNAPMRAANSVP